jgi:hypothetical protein
MSTDVLSITATSQSEAIKKATDSFGVLVDGSEEMDAFLSLLPRGSNLQPFNDITTIVEWTKDKDGKYLVELGEDPRVEKLKLKIKKTLPVGCEKLTLEQARARMPVGGV